MYTFGGQLGVGQEGEKLFKLFLIAHIPQHAYIDVSHDPEWQARGIDLTVMPLSTDPEYTVDIKTDTHATDNIALEVRLTDEQGERPGCAVTGEADYWAYVRVHPRHRDILCLDGPRLREYARTLTPTVQVRNRNPRTGATWTAHVALVPTAVLRRNGVLLGRPRPIIHTYGDIV